MLYNTSFQKSTPIDGKGFDVQRIFVVEMLD